MSSHVIHIVKDSIPNLIPDLSEYDEEGNYSKKLNYDLKYSNAKFEDLKGKTMLEIYKNKDLGDDYLLFRTEDDIYILYHDQNCCEQVYIEDICGDLDDLIGSPIRMAQEVSNQSRKRISEDDESFTWTFYKLATIKGSVTIRWYGTSNGYYSESVDFIKLEK